ncbi:allantoinase [Halalkalibacter wakoensis JCM 9140]|uniref:Allantoinase n=1 Tax=Halalkalibacter wakoensis JCM 9140 TaxID=1236970 RepID=W4Q6G4_9BACI|nr:amidohydrolase family protein [Halalkalibacter wakoensis]GAE27587.1 allantoinase [Halalkalibacter wakoensis JCM 9140]
MSTFDLVVSGRIVGEETVIYGEIGINKGKIIDICEGIGNFVGRERIDAHQSYVFPGAIDVHVHCFSNPEEGFYSTSAAAAAGGVTTFLDMPYDLPNPINHVDQLNKKIEKLEKEAVVDVGLWGLFQSGMEQIKLSRWHKLVQWPLKCPLLKQMNTVFPKFLTQKL